MTSCAPRRASITLPDEQQVTRRLTKLEHRVRNLESELTPEAGLLAARPVDHLVETLVRYRPTWPASVGDPFRRSSTTRSGRHLPSSAPSSSTR